MPGFPLRPNRNSLGQAKVEDLGTVAGDPERDIGANEINVLAWQTAGAGKTADLAWVSIFGDDGSRLAGGEAWNPRDDAALYPACARLSSGIYTVTVAAEYPDERVMIGDVLSAMSPLTIKGAWATPQVSGTPVIATARVSGPTSGQWVITVSVYLIGVGGATLLDCDVLVGLK